ncbi:MAG: hypothetical protein II748_01550, partial [Clostridia bacterium]|nr:hypothetical protein [Clostridia bacterium]
AQNQSTNRSVEEKCCLKRPGIINKQYNLEKIVDRACLSLIKQTVISPFFSLIGKLFQIKSCEQCDQNDRFARSFPLI